DVRPLRLLFQGSEICAREWVCRRHGVAPRPKLPRHLEERTSLCGRYVSLFLAAFFPINPLVEHNLLLLGEQVVQSVNLASGVRQRSAPLHYLVEVAAMPLAEG